MPLTFQGIEDGFYKYRDLATGTNSLSDAKVDSALGNEISDDEQIAQRFGGVNFEPGKEEVEGHSHAPKSYSESIQSRKYEADGKTVDAGQAPSSLFNSWNLFKYKSLALGNTDDTVNKPSALKGVENLNKPNIINPTASSIVEWSGEEGRGPGCRYTYRDFIQCEHYGTIPNNYMLTLRRFPFPAPDDIYSPRVFDIKDQKSKEADQPDIARAITWMSPELGNELKSMFSFDVGFNWKDVEAQVQEVQGRTDRGNIGNRFSASPLLTALEAGANGYTAEQSARIREKGAGWDPLTETYPNHVYGPLNVIKSMMVRDRGINFSQEFTLTFHYDLKAYGNISPKAAFMDTLSNLLVLTTNNAPFWGGATRGVSNGLTGKPFGDLSKLSSGDYSGFFEGIANDFSSLASNIWNGGDPLNSKALNNVIGGGLMELFGSNQGASVLQAFLTGDPTGQWHLTVGNPMNPAMVIGNLGLQNAKFEFEGPLGYEDFPTRLKVTVSLKPGRPRDKSDIESMFSVGKGRTYIQPDGAEDISLVNPGAYGKKDFGGGLYSSASDMASA